MSFNWDTDENDAWQAPSADPRISPAQGRIIYRLAIVLLAVLLILIGWGSWQIRQERAQTEIVIQTFLDEQSERVVAGDGEPFFKAIGSDWHWEADQLHPRSMEFWHGRPRVTDFTYHQDLILAQVEFDSAAGEPLARLIMLREEVGGTVSMASPPVSFWGNLVTEETRWGTLHFYAVDEAWKQGFLDLLGGLEAEYCDGRAAEPCFEVDLFISIRNRTLPTMLAFPSPRTWGLNSQGEPPDAYWDALRSHLIANVPLEETALRIGIPDNQYAGYYQFWASMHNTGSAPFSLEIVLYDPTDPAGLDLKTVDGALVSPTFEMLKAGDLLDMTDLIANDPDLSIQDFYAQHWEAARWRSRTWFVPRSAEYAVMYVDTPDRMVSPPIGQRWVWADVDAFANVAAREGGYPSRFMSQRPDWMYALAFSHANQCIGAVQSSCLGPLEPEDLSFVLEIADRYPALLPDAYEPSLNPELTTPNFPAGSAADVPIWIDSVSQYSINGLERQALPMPMPAAADGQDILPLWVDGYVISAHSDHPMLVWRWIRDIDDVTFGRADQQIPARRSLAARVNFWDRRPSPLGIFVEPLFFNAARPVLLEERGLLHVGLMAELEAGNSAEAISRDQIDRQKRGWFGATP